MPAAAQAARRALKNRALYFLGELGDGKVTADLLRRTREATNMTDHIAALAALIDHPGAPYPMPVCSQHDQSYCRAGGVRLKYLCVPQDPHPWLQRAA